MLAEELLEGRKQVADPQRAIATDEPLGIVVDRHFLSGVRQVARDHLPIDRIGDSHRAGSRDQAEVANVFQIVSSDVGNGRVPAKQRLDHPPDPLFLQLVRQLIEMRLATENELLPRFLHGV